MYDIRNLNIWKQEPEKNKRNSEYLDADISELELSVRSYNCLKRAGCSTIGEIIKLTDEDENGLRKIRNLGSRSETEILKAIEQFRELKAKTPESPFAGKIIKRAFIQPTKIIWEARMEAFNLSDCALTELRKSGIHQVRDLYETDPKNEPGWYAVRELFEKIPSV